MKARSGLVLVIVFLALGCTHRIEESQVGALVAPPDLDTLYYMGRKGSACYLYHERFMAWDRYYVVDPGSDDFFPPLDYTKDRRAWLPVHVHVGSTGNSWIWIQGSRFDPMGYQGPGLASGELNLRLRP